MDDPYEEGLSEEYGSPLTHVVAGLLAGTVEHCGMFPLDTIKTQQQVIKSAGSTVVPTAREIVANTGIRGLFRGMSVVVAGAAPSHMLSFTIYEAFKNLFGGNKPGYHPFALSAAGIFSTICHDACLCPIDSIKQRMQLKLIPYDSVMDCIRKSIRNEGILSLYSGYTTTLTMNIPFSAIQYPAYGLTRKFLRRRFGLDEVTPHTVTHLTAGAFAGVVASGLTNPLDVIRTRLQTQCDTGIKYEGMVDALKRIPAEEGYSAFLRGIKFRMLFHSLSGALVWTTYEQVKWWFSTTKR